MTLRIELESGGKLSFSAPLYANDALSDRFLGPDEYGAFLGSSSGCKSKPLPRGNGYSVEARISVNSEGLNGRWVFDVN